MTNTDKQLKLLTEAITKLVNNPVAPIAPVAPVAPVLPIVTQNSGDHDLLTKLDTKVDQIQVDVNALKTQNSVYVTRSEFTEVVRIQGDHETRTRTLETFRDNLMGKMIALGSLSGLITGIIFLVINHFWK